MFEVLPKLEMLNLKHLKRFYRSFPVERVGRERLGLVETCGGLLAFSKMKTIFSKLGLHCHPLSQLLPNNVGTKIDFWHGALSVEVVRGMSKNH